MKTEQEPILKVEGVNKYFGSFAALKDVTIEIQPNQIFGIAGPNGAGKTTLFNVITHVIPLTSGKIFFEGEPIHNLPAHEICHKGITRTFQVPVIFRSMSTFETVRVGALFGREGKLSIPKSERDIEKGCESVLELVGLTQKRDAKSEDLSLLDRKRLMIASALITNPKMLLLDEPIAGLSSEEIEEALKLIKEVNKQGITIVLIEHIMKALMGLSDHVMILHHGEKICEGTPNEVSKEECVIEAFLGETARKA